MDHVGRSVLLLIFWIAACCGSDKVLICSYEEGYTDNYDISPPDLCTHIVFFWLNQVFNRNMLNTDTQTKIIPRLEKLKRENPNLKILLGIGGDTFNEDPTNDQDDFQYRLDILKNTISEYEFDGVDVYWYSPPWEIKSSKKFKRVKEYLHQNGKILSLTLATTPQSLANLTILDSISDFPDFVSIASFDRVNDRAAAISPLNSDTIYNIKYAVDFMLKRVPKSKLLLAVPAFGWKTEYYEKDGILLRRSRQEAYRNVCFILSRQKSKWQESWNFISSTPYAVNKENGHIINFDNVASFKKKCDYIKEKGLRGAMLIDLEYDDYKGNCGMGKFPLAFTLKNELDIVSAPFSYSLSVVNEVMTSY